jgi:signal transduction histidine kinase
MPKFDAWERALGVFAKVKEGQLETARWEARAAGNRALRLIVVIAVGALILALTLGLVLTRTLTRLYERTRIAVRAREDVLAVVSHDLRNPQSSVMLSSAMLTKNPEMSEESRLKLTRTISSSSQQMKRLIDDLLDFVKVEGGHMTVTKKLEDPKTLLSELHAIFLPLATEKKLKLTYAIGNAVTAIACEKGRLAQVLSNLLGNAIKFTPEGGIVSLEVSPSGSETLFCVRDSGPGIPTE